MENRATFTSSKLRNLCIENDWFTAGTNEQYDKLFYLNLEGADIVTLSYVIWICSSDVELHDILNVLCENKLNG